MAKSNILLYEKSHVMQIVKSVIPGDSFNIFTFTTTTYTHTHTLNKYTHHSYYLCRSSVTLTWSQISLILKYFSKTFHELI